MSSPLAPPFMPTVQVMPSPIVGNIVVPVSGPKGDKGDPGTLDGVAAVQEMIDDSVAEHVAAPEPHPAYDDIPSLVLLFENGLA